MLSRKGTISRKNRASIRRGRSGRGGVGGGTGSGAGSMCGGVNSIGSGSSSRAASSFSASHSMQSSRKSTSSREISISTLDNYCSLADKTFANSERSPSFDLRVQDNHNHHDGTGTDMILTILPAASSLNSSGNRTNDCSPSEQLMFTYQSIGASKILYTSTPLTATMSSSSKPDVVVGNQGSGGQGVSSPGYGSQFSNKPDTNDDPIVTVAEWMAHLAMLIYLYAAYGDRIFKSCFFRQLSFILQLIKLFMIFASLLPCVIHSQAKSMAPGITGNIGRVFVIATLLILNIFIAIRIQRYIEQCASPVICVPKVETCKISCVTEQRVKPRKTECCKKKRTCLW